MVTVKIIPARLEHIDLIADDVRAEDREELWVAAFQTPPLAMKSGIRFSSKAFTGFANGEAVCMFGVVHESLIGSVGVPWMIATNKLDKYARVFIRECRSSMMVELSDGYDNLVNYVDARNMRAIRWLRWLGFNVEDEPKPYGALNMPFHRFSVGRN